MAWPQLKAEEEEAEAILLQRHRLPAEERAEVEVVPQLQDKWALQEQRLLEAFDIDGWMDGRGPSERADVRAHLRCDVVHFRGFDGVKKHTIWPLTNAPLGHISRRRAASLPPICLHVP